MNEYFGVGRILYQDACFVPICEKCGRFVKADETIVFNGLGDISTETNAICSKCGRTHMLFEGFVDTGDFK